METCKECEKCMMNKGCKGYTNCMAWRAWFAKHWRNIQKAAGVYGKRKI